MAAPLAAVREMEVLELVDVGPGIMETAAPLSARKQTPVVWSWRKTNSPVILIDKMHYFQTIE